MDVGRLKRAVLLNMNEKCDENTLLEYGDEILEYINQAYLQVMTTKVKPVKTVSCKSENNRIAKCDIGGDFFEINRITDKYGMEKRYSFNGEYLFLDDGEYEVEYVYVPESLDEDRDVPQMDIGFHYILSDYATYRMFLKGSKARQARGDAFLSSYLNGLARMYPPKNVAIRNKFGCDVIG